MDWTDFVDDRPFVAPIMTDEENHYYATFNKMWVRWLIIIAAIIIALLLFYFYVV